MVSLPRGSLRTGCSGFERLGLVDARQVHLDGCSRPHLAVDFHAAAALLHDPEDRGKAQAGSLAGSLGGEERLEQAGLGGRIHAGSVIADRQHDVPPGLDRDVAARRSASSSSTLAGLDGQDAALRHGVACIDHQVHKHLFHLPGIGADAAQIGTEHQAQVDILADQPLQHGAETGHQPVQIEHLGLQHLAAAERQQLLGQGGSALPGLHDLLHRVAVLIAVGKAVENQLAVTGDDGEQIIEIMGDTARQHADRFHLLRLPELVFQLHPSADIHQDGKLCGPAAILDVMERNLHLNRPPGFGTMPDSNRNPDSGCIGIFTREPLLDRPETAGPKPASNEAPRGEYSYRLAAAAFTSRIRWFSASEIHMGCGCSSNRSRNFLSFCLNSCFAAIASAIQKRSGKAFRPLDLPAD